VNHAPFLVILVVLAACNADSGMSPTGTTSQPGTMGRESAASTTPGNPAQETPAEAIGRGRTVRRVAGVTIRTRYRYYDIVGFSGTQLRAQMDRRGPRGEAGRRGDAMTAWHIGTRYEYRGSASNCAVTSAIVSLKIGYTYPRWRGWKAARSYAAELASVWVHYLRLLARHEKRHGRIALEGAIDLSRRLRSLPTYATCSALEEEVEALVQTIVRQTTRRQKDYDKRTRHGATEGVRFA
jgi:predicted secreted Zn-dependent protease